MELHEWMLEVGIELGHKGGSVTLSDVDYGYLAEAFENGCMTPADAADEIWSNFYVDVEPYFPPQKPVGASKFTTSKRV